MLVHQIKCSNCEDITRFWIRDSETGLFPGAGSMIQSWGGYLSSIKDAINYDYNFFY